MKSTLFRDARLGFRFGCPKLPFFSLGEGGTVDVLVGAVRLLFEAVEVTDSASDPLWPFALCLAIELLYLSKPCLPCFGDDVNFRAIFLLRRQGLSIFLVFADFETCHSTP